MTFLQWGGYRMFPPSDDLERGDKLDGQKIIAVRFISSGKSYQVNRYLTSHTRTSTRTLTRSLIGSTGYHSTPVMSRSP